MFHQFTLKVNYISRKFGMTLSGRNCIACGSIPAAAGSRCIAKLRPVSMGQVLSKDAPSQMIETMYFE